MDEWNGCAVSVDLDPLRCYYDIHGLGGSPSKELEDIVFRRAVPRFLDIFEALDVRATFFVVAKDVEQDGSFASELLREMSERGHEIANHSYEHSYDMARFSRRDVAQEFRKAHKILATRTGKQPVGFRAPGYDLSPAMLQCLLEFGYKYDSSLFPSWPYYFAKSVVMTWMHLRRRQTAAVMTDPRALLCPRIPYHPREAYPWQRGSAPIWEVPVGVTPGIRLPVIGTNLLLMPTPARLAMLESVKLGNFFNLEFHGLDLIDAAQDGIAKDLIKVQPDLRLTSRKKESVIRRSLESLGRRFEFKTLAGFC